MFLNSLTVEGNAGRDGELKLLDGGKKVAKASIAVYMGKDKPPMWLELKGWDRMADCLAEIKKGDAVVVTGNLGQETWKGNDGTEKSATVLNVQGFSWGSKPQRAAAPVANSGDNGVPW